MKRLAQLEYTTKNGKKHTHVISFGENNEISLHEGTSVSKISLSSDATIRSVACSPDGKRIAVAYHDASTFIYCYDEELEKHEGLHPFLQSEMHKHFTGPSFTSPITDLAFDPRSSRMRGYFLAVASQDEGLRVYNVASKQTMDESNILADEAEQYGGVGSLSYSTIVKQGGEDMTFLAALGKDGILTIYKCPGTESPDINWGEWYRGNKVIVEANENFYHQVSWTPSCNLLSLPGSKDVELRVVDDSKDSLFALPRYILSPNPSSVIVSSVSSTLENIIFTLAQNGQICAWDLNYKLAYSKDADASKPVGRFKCEILPTSETECAVHFTLDKDILCVLTNSGNFKRIPLKTVLPANANHSLLETQPPMPKRRLNSKVKAQGGDDVLDFDAMNQNPVGKSKNMFVDDDADSDDEAEDASFIDENATGVKDEFRAGFDKSFDDEDEKSSTFDVSKYSSFLRQPPPEPPQEAFAPSSTPVNMEQPNMRRILCWNHIGVITSRRDEVHEEQNVVDINLNDATLGGTRHFMDSFGLDQGSLGEDGAIFATYNGVSDFEGSKVFFYRFDTIGPVKRKDWSATLPAGENALGCACGEGWAAVVTSRRFLRLFTSGGIQRIVVCIKGDPVTIVGRGRLVAIIFHEALPLADKTQRLGYILMDAVEGTTIVTGSVAAVQKGHKLTWAGFSNDHSLAVMDSLGLVSVLSSASKWQWVPVLDTLGKKKSSEDSFWPISIMHGNFVCVPLKGGHEHPDATRRPITTSLEMHIPLAQGMKKTMALEETLIRAKMALGQKKFYDSLLLEGGGADKDEIDEEYHRACSQVDKVTIKLFHAALEAGSVERALDLVSMLHVEMSFDILVTVANQLNHPNLIEKIEWIKQSRFPPSEEEEVDYPHSIDPLVDFPPTQSQQSRVTPDSRVSQATHRLGDKRPLQSDLEINLSNTENTNLASPQPQTHSAIKPKNLNPFAKKVVHSPTKKSKITLSPPKKQLSRLSTFTVKAKASQKSMKHFL